MADLSKITLPNGSNYNLKDAIAYRNGDWIRNTQTSTNIAPMYVKMFGNKKRTDYFQSIRAFAGEGDWLYCADKDSHFTITCSKAVGGDYGNYKCLFNHNMSDTLLVRLTDLPFILEVLKDSNITATDVIYLMTCSHTLGTGMGKLTDYKIEVYVTSATSASSLIANSWNTVVERTGVSDEVQGMIHSLNVGSGGYAYIRGIRLTITGITPASTSSSAWNYNALPITSLQLIDGRPAFTAAQGLGALDVVGGTVFGQTTFRNGITGDLTGKVNNHTVDKDVPSNAVFTDTKDLTQMTGTLPVSHGGTGATDASGARTNLGLKAAATYEVETTVANDSKLPTGAAVKSFVEGKGYVTTDTKNTTGSTDTSSKIFLVGATSQAANPQTYSDNEVYATDGKLSMKEAQIGGDSGPIARYNATTKSLDFVFS